MIEFDEATHTYRVDGEIVRPTVTEVIRDVLERDTFYNGHRELMEKGRAMHMALHLDDEGDLDENTLLPEIMPELLKWRRWKKAVEWEPLRHEEIVYDEELHVAGRFDTIGIAHRLGSEPILLDWKRSSSLRWQVCVQTALYRLCLGESRETMGIGAVALRTDGEDATFWDCDRQLPGAARYAEAAVRVWHLLHMKGVIR